MNVDIGVATIAAVMSLVVGFVGGRMVRRNDYLRHRRERVSAAYGSYLESVGEMEAANKKSDQQAILDASGRAIAAKTHLCVDGSADVVQAVANFERRGTGQMRATMFAVVEAMRRDVGAEGAVSEDDVSEILFGPRPA